MASGLKTALIDKVREAGGADFILVELTKGEMTPVYDGEGQLLKFASGGDADKAARKMSEDKGIKIQPRRVTDGNWREREQKKMDDGTYRKLPWHAEPWWQEMAPIHREHFPHVSLNNPALIAFTSNEQEGSADLQASIRPGRYLERFFSKELNKYLIRDLASVYAKTYETNELQYADDAESIEEVYTIGPNSCMSKDSASYKKDAPHPVRAYAGGDLRVAYLRRQGRVVARSVVWPEKKMFNTIYGDKALMEPLLRKAGLKLGAPVGARLSKIKHPVSDVDGSYCFMVPHVDNIPYYVADGDYIKTGDPNIAMDKVGGFQVSGGSGISEPMFSCEGCTKADLPARGMQAVFIDNTKSRRRCPSCISRDAVHCVVSGYLILRDMAVPLGDGKKKVWAWKKYVGNKVAQCDGNKMFYAMSELIVLPDGRKWSKEFWEEAGGFCAACGIKVERGYVCDLKCKNPKPSGVVKSSLTMTGAGTGSVTYSSSNATDWR